MPLLLGFAELAAGVLLMVAGTTGSSLASVVRGKPDRGKAQTGVVAGGAAAPATSAGSTSGVGATTAAQGTVTASMLSSYAKAHGWDASQVAAWLGVIARESGGNPTVQNSHSKAYGIAQFIDGPSEYYTYGGNPTTVTGQLTAMANYIQQRYGTPTNALAHENAYGWY